VQISATAFPASLEATVTALIPTGGSWIVEMSLQDGRTSVLHAAPNRPDFTPSQRVFITPKPDGLHFFGPDGRAISVSPMQKETP
jgi:hypothetical protein